MNFKIILPLLCLSVFLLACNGINSNSGKQTQSTTNDSIGNLAELEKAALLSKKVTDTVLLGFKFGMTKDQVLNHTQSLYHEGKLKQDYNGKYYFEIATKTGEANKGFLFADYFENKLFSIGLTFSKATSNILVFSAMNDLLKQKYGDADMMDKPFNMDVYESYWLRNNLKIRLTSGMPEASVHYIDMRYEKQKEHADSVEKANSAQKVKSNL